MTNLVGARTRSASVLAAGIDQPSFDDLGTLLWQDDGTASGLFLPTWQQGKNGAAFAMLVDSTGNAISSSNPTTVGGTTPRLTASMNGASAAGAYSAGNIIANSANAALVVPLTFTPGRNSGRITGCRCVVTPASGNVIITALDFELLLFRSNTNIPFAAGSYPADRTACNFTAAAFRELVGTFRFVSSAWRNPAGTLVAGATGYQAVVPNSSRVIEPFNIAGLAGTILGVVQYIGAGWTPGAVVNQFDFALDADLD